MVTFNRGDVAALADLYTENGQLLPAGSDFVTGKQDYQDFFGLVWLYPVHLACQGEVSL
jgi:ketosteroid isomerase-like protein